MPKPVFHEYTLHDLQRFMQQLPQALGLHGAQGAGLLTAATYLAKGANASQQIIHPEKSGEVNIESGSITIDIIRRLRESTRGKSTQQRCIIITKADTMTHQAQNAFLKLLEEPSQNTTFILLIHQTDTLLPTVSSRLQRCLIRPITVEQSNQLLDRLSVTDHKARQQILFLASGRPAELTRLATNETLLSTEATSLRQAREFVQGSLYEQLMICHAVKNSRSDALRLVGHAITIIQHDIRTRQSADTTMVQRLSQLEHATAQLNANGNPRLVLARAVLAG